MANISDNGLIVAPFVHNAVLGTESFDNNLQIEFFEKWYPCLYQFISIQQICIDGLFQKLGIHQ